MKPQLKKNGRLHLNSETLRHLGVRSGVKTGAGVGTSLETNACPYSDGCSNHPSCRSYKW